MYASNDDDGGARHSQRFGEDIRLPDEAYLDQRRELGEDNLFDGLEPTTHYFTASKTSFGLGGDMVEDDGRVCGVARPLPRHVTTKLNGPEGELWRAAFQKEIDSVRSYGVYRPGFSMQDSATAAAPSSTR